VVVRKFAGAARRPTPHPPEPPPSLSTRGEAAAAPPAFPNQIRRGVTASGRVEERPSYCAWLRDDFANEPTGFFACGEQNSLWALGARVALVLFLFVASLTPQAAVREGARLDFGRRTWPATRRRPTSSGLGWSK
jgi:hypothetical protein